MTWAVAFHPDLTLAVEAVGPFRSQARAEAVCANLSATIDSHEPDDHHPSRLPQVVQLISEAEAVERYQSGGR